MAKQELYSYLERKQKEAIKFCDDTFREQYEKLENEKLEQYHVHEEAARLRKLGMDIYNGHLSWAEQFSITNSGQYGEYPKYELNAYNGVIRIVNGHSSCFNLTETEENIYNQLKKLINLGDDELNKLKNTWMKTKHDIDSEYKKLIAVCKETRSVNKLVKYLVDLGFEELTMRELLDAPVPTALSTNINSSLLFIGGKKHDRND